ncbi:MAG: hypothetical protein AAB426_08655 [Myxococcota bacterium]
MTAAFACSVDASYRAKKDVTAFVISVSELPAGLNGLAPASFNLPGKPTKKVYDLAALGDGGTIINRQDGRTFFGSKVGGKVYGSVKLTLSAVSAQSERSYAVSGTLSAVAVDMEGKGEIKVEVSF